MPTVNISTTVAKQMSITSDGSGLKLDGDEATPGASKYYGTDGGGTKGFHAVSGSAGATGATGASSTVPGATGATGASFTGATGAAFTGATGSVGRNAGLKYTFNSSTTPADPGSGKFLLDDVVADATAIFISTTDGDTNDLTDFFGALNTYQAVSLMIRKDSDPAVFAAFIVTLSAQNSGYDQLDITSLLASHGSFANNDVCKIEITAFGNDGEDGGQGATGASFTGATGAAFTGATGAAFTGATGASGSDGTAFQWEGEWDDSTVYAVNDVVYRDGSSYIAPGGAGSGVDPLDGSPWELVALHGEDGSNGGQGATGSTGAAFTGATGAAFTGATGAAFTGATGAAGHSQIWYNGSGTPIGSQSGVDGDFYLNDDNGDVYQHGVGPSLTDWTVIANITGPQGNDGSNGTNGATGATGASFTGATGASFTGATGASGSDGTSFQWNGEWDDATAYNVNDVVYRDGSSYIAPGGSSIGDDPLDGSPWELVALHGADGSNGSQGATGSTGASFTGATGAAFTGATGASFTGATGASGTAQVWFNGAGTPVGSVSGVDGDFYLNDTNGDVYQHGPGAALTDWGIIANIKGPAGNQGSTGATGAAFTGATGAAFTGATGASFTGATGASFTGATGATGAAISTTTHSVVSLVEFDEEECELTVTYLHSAYVTTGYTTDGTP